MVAGVRVHRGLAEQCGAVLAALFEEGCVLERGLARAFGAHPKWGKRDRAFVAESAYEVARWRRGLEFVAGSGEVAALLAAQWTRMGLEVPEWWSWRGESAEEMRRREGELGAQPRAVRESVPDWLDDLGAEELGDRWGRELAALNRRAPVVVRVNPLQVSLAEARERLAAAGVAAEPVAGAADALCLAAGRILPVRLLEEGWVEIQDAGSQQVAPLLDARPGMKVVDACAGAGGKALHLACLMENRGEILAMDVSGEKLAELRRRVARGRVSNLRTTGLGADTVARHREWADRLLLDVPCSGLGTLRRQPDLKWRLTPGRLAEVRELQRRILVEYPVMLKPGGRMVYATCSVLPSENQAQARWLLERGGFEMTGEKVVSPADSGWDGFYAAVMEKTGRGTA